MKGGAAGGLRQWHDFILLFDAEYMLPEKSNGEAKVTKKPPPMKGCVMHPLFGDMFGLGK